MNLFSQEFSQIGNKSNLGELAAAVSDQEISDYVFNVLNTPGLSDQDRAAQIANAASQYGVSNEDISKATGYTITQVVDYLNLAVSPTPIEIANQSQVVVNQEISDQQIADYVSNVLNTPGLSDQERAAQIANAASQYSISNEDISRATGYTVTQVLDYLDLANKQYSEVISTPITNVPKNTTSSGISYSEVKRVIDYYLNDTRLTDQDRAAVIQGYARDNNISLNELSEITGYSTDEISKYFALAFHPSLENAAQKIIEQNKKNELENAAIAAANIKAAQDAAIAAANAKAAKEKAAQDAAIAAAATAKAKAAQDAAIAAANAKAAQDAAIAAQSRTEAIAKQEAADKAKLIASKNPANETFATNVKIAQDVANLAKLKADTDAQNAANSQKVVQVATETKTIQPNVIQTNQTSNSGILILAAIAAYLIGS